ncbi:MAG: ECF transporter S component [Anaerolineales bacterium]|nr:ECF transporter S component [Anaerolineales bacterium]
MPTKTSSKWNTRDLMVTLVIGLAVGVLFIPTTIIYVGSLAGGMLARSVIGGVYFLPAVFAAYVIRKPGAGLLASAVGGMVALASPNGFIAMIVCIMIGLLGDLLIWLITRYKSFSASKLGLAGFVTGLGVFLAMLSRLGGDDMQLAVVVPALLVSGLAFAACALLAKALADAVARTGVLANTGLGKENVEEI